MKHHSFLPFLAALLIMIALSLAIAPPAFALDLNPADYFQVAYEPVTFDKTTVAPGDVFHATLKGRATCTQDLPLNISELKITSQVIARPASGGSEVTLNPQYIIDIKPLPSKAGQYYDINQTVALQFPAGTAPGTYTVIGKIAKAEITINVLISYTQDITGSFPPESNMGTVKCAVPSPTTTAVILPTFPSPTAPATTTPAGATSPAATTPTSSFPLTTIAIIALLVVVAILLVLVVVLLRRSRIP
jgi:disulfide bond formation protein DsbB